MTIGGNAEKDYENMLSAVSGLAADEKNIIAVMANVSAVIFHNVKTINWAGFYIKEGEGLVLGPFQGKPACVRIPPGKGVCGAAALQKKTLIVNDVHSFPGHIACDGDSASEIVVPIMKNGEVFGVLDVDSPETARFTELERKYFEEIAVIIGKAL